MVTTATDPNGRVSLDGLTLGRPVSAARSRSSGSRRPDA